MRLRHVLSVLVLSAVPVAAQAQDARLYRLPAATRAQVATIIDAAEQSGLPREPLVQKALEGATKRAAPASIVNAVRVLAERMRIARDALGEESSADDLVAGASALYMGFSPQSLAGFRARRGDGPLALSLLTAVFFTQHGVDPDRSGTLVLELMAVGDPLDERLLWLQRTIREDVASGVPPAQAVDRRVRSVVGGTVR